MDTKALANNLVRRYGTRDPFQIAEALGFIILTVPLVDVRGYHQYVHRCHIIYLADQLTDWERRWVCAHELGHALLHKGLNRIFMDSCTLMISSKYETAADRFAADLLYDDYDLQDLLDYPIDTAAQAMGLDDQRLASYRLGTVQPRLWR